MKALRYIIIGILLAVMLGLAGYAIFIKKEFDAGDIAKFAIAICGVVISLFKPRKRTRVTNKKALYRKAYGEYLQNAFSDEPKLESKLYDAIHDYNQDKPAEAVEKLEKLRKQCQRSTDLYAVTVFTALCLDDMKQYEQAADQYEAALNIRQNSSLTSNMGLCCQRMGDFERSEVLYQRAITLDESNAVAYNNLSALHFARGEYESALEFAESALKHNERMPQALSTAAICASLLGDRDNYETYYRRAVAAGYNGKKIKDAIAALDPEP